jgi:hypothetical protein
MFDEKCFFLEWHARGPNTKRIKNAVATHRGEKSLKVPAAAVLDDDEGGFLLANIPTNTADIVCPKAPGKLSRKKLGARRRVRRRRRQRPLDTDLGDPSRGFRAAGKIPESPSKSPPPPFSTTRRAAGKIIARKHTQKHCRHWVPESAARIEQEGIGCPSEYRKP